MTKLQLQNLAWTSTSKSWPNLETLCSKSEQKLNFMTKLHLPHLHQTVVNTFLIINMNNRNNLNKFELSSSHARVTSIKFTKQEWVSEWVTDKYSQWSDLGPIIMVWRHQRMVWSGEMASPYAKTSLSRFQRLYWSRKIFFWQSTAGNEFCLCATIGFRPVQDI